MIARDALVAFLDELLAPDQYPDACPNGLQVYGREEVGRIATCPSVSYRFFEQAIQSRADTLLVHHGLFWDRDPRVIVPHLGARLRLLLDGQINLIAYHLPLDAHRELGNNARLAGELGLEELDWSFGQVRGKPIGVAGTLPVTLPLDELCVKVGEVTGGVAQTIEHGAGPVGRIGVLSGSGGDISVILECRRSNCDVLVTGNLSEQTVAVARELDIGVICAGHYNSEKLGVIAVGDRVADRFGVEVVHLDVPNPV